MSCRRVSSALLTVALAVLALVAVPASVSAAPVQQHASPITSAYGVALDQARNRLYVTGYYQPGTITALDATTLQVVASAATVSSPTGVDVDQTTGNIYLAHQGNGDRVTVLDPSLTQIADIPITNPFTPVVNESTRRVYFAQTFGGGIEVVDADTNTMITTVPTTGDSTIAVDIDQSRNLVFAVDRHDNTLAIMDGATNTIINTIAIGTTPQDLAVDEVLDKVYVANTNANAVYVYRGSTGAFLDAFSTPSPMGVAINNQDHRAYITNSGANTVSVADTRYDAIVDVVSSSSAQPWHVVTNDAAHLAYYTTLSQGVASISDPPAPAAQIVGVPNSPAAEAAFDASTAGQTMSLVNFDDGLVSDGQPVTTAYASLGVQFSGIVARATPNFTYSPPMGVWQANFNVGPPAEVVIDFPSPVASVGFYANDIEADARVRIVFSDSEHGAYAAPAPGGGATSATFYGFTAPTNTISQVRIATGDYFIFDHVKFGRIQQNFPLSVTKAGTGDGSITSLDGSIQCGSTCSATLTESTSVTLNATAASGSEFTGWSGACAGTAACVVTMDAAKDVTATFETIPVSGDDGDGIPDAVEDAAPNWGDGNGDGALDSTQSNVASLPSATSGEYVTIAAPAGTSLVAVDSTSVVQPAPPNVEFPADLLAFRVVGVAPGGSASVQVFMPYDVTPDAFWKYQNGGYVQFPDAVAAGNVATLTLHDGGAFDEDGVANGIIVDPIAIGDTLYSLSVTKAGSGDGSITSWDGAIQCGSTCSATLPGGTVEVLTANAASGSEFTGWSGACAGTAVCVLTIDDANDVTATFETAPLGISGTVTDLNGNPLAGIWVEAIAANNTTVYTVTDTLGHYTISDAPPGWYRVRFTDPSTPRYYDVQYYDEKGSLDSANYVQVGSGGAVTGIDAVLVSTTISGTVTGAGGLPVEGIYVHASANGGSDSAGAYTDAAGNYTIRGLSAGSYEVSFRDDRTPKVYSSQTRPGSVTVASRDAVTGIDAALVITSISGTVTDSSGSGIEGIQVLAYSNTLGYWYGTTDAAGNYTVSGLSPGSYTLSYTDTRDPRLYTGDWIPAAVSIASGEQLSGYDMTLVITSISGTVTGVDGLPVAGILVDVQDNGLSTAGYTYTDAAGHYTVTGMGTGSYRIRFSDVSATPLYSPQYYPGLRDFWPSAPVVSVVAGQALTDFDDQLVVTAVSGTVTDSNGVPLPGIQASVQGNSGWAGGAVTDGGGHYRITGLPAGTFHVEFYDPNSVYPDKSSSSFTLTHGGPERVVDAEFAAVSGPDGDGIPAVVEDAAPNGGDGNGDGIADSAQNHVTSLPAATSGEYVTLAGPAGTSLVAVASTPVVLPAPPNVEFPAGLLAFRVVGVAPGGSASVQVFLPPDVTPDAFWKYQNGGYVQFPDAVVAGNVVTLTLQDGGPFDEDGVANGVIVDPIAIGDATAVGTTTSVSSAANPSSFGDPVTFTATVAPASGTADAAGTVTFTVDGVEQLPPVALTSGTASLPPITSLALGAHTVTAAYTPGTGSFLPSDSHAEPFLHTVEPGPLHHLALSPASSTIHSGQLQLYTVGGFDAYGNALGDQTADAVFSIAPNGACSANRCTATTPGAHTVTAHVGSAAGSATLAVSAPVVPGAPSVVSVTPSLKQIAVAFAAPASDGGAPITGYTAKCTSSDGGVTKSVLGTGSPIVVTNLTNSKTYTCTVVAKNAVGSGEASAPSTAVVLPVVPGAPSVMSVTPSLRQIAVGFAAPVSDGGAPITGYTASCTSSDGGVAKTVNGTASPILVTGLTNSKTYTCTVVAKNAVGSGPVSAPSSAVMLPVVPGAPSVVSVTPSLRQIAVGFAAPASDGGAPITGYTASCTSSDGGVAKTVNGTVSPILVTGLTNSKTYICTVLAKNAVGSGPVSAPSSAVMLPVVPGAPSVVSVTPGARQIGVGFAAPASDGGAPITGYTVKCTSSNGGAAKSVNGSGSPILVTGLTKAKTYTCTVLAKNAVGSGPVSAPSAAVVVLGP